nr:zinc ABC transporter substrate-binding protein [Sporosarcina sp. BP05]
MILTACSNEGSPTSEESDERKLEIYTTIYPFQYFTERIGGDAVSTKSIVPPGADAHSIDITMKEMAKLADSDAFIHSGTGLESFAKSVIEAMENENVKIINATKNVKLISGQVDPHDVEEENSVEHSEEENEDVHDEHGDEFAVDPHAWLDPIRSTIIAENIKNALIELDPKNKPVFEENFNSLKKDLEQLNKEFTDVINNSKSKTFIVSHSAYGYWEDAYGLKQIAISGLSPFDEPSQSKIVEIIKSVKENNLQYIYYETNVKNKIANTVKKETGLETLALHNLESISKENIESNEDYLSLMKKNIEALSQELNQK